MQLKICKISLEKLERPNAYRFCFKSICFQVFLLTIVVYYKVIEYQIGPYYLSAQSLMKTMRPGVQAFFIYVHYKCRMSY